MVSVRGTEKAVPENETAGPSGARPAATKETSRDSDGDPNGADASANNGTAQAAVTVTFFKNWAAATKDAKATTLAALRDLILSTSAAIKEQLPWLKLATFGDRRSKKGNSLRHNANVQTITGVEVDYDGEEIPFHNAVVIIRAGRSQRTGLHVAVALADKTTLAHPAADLAGIASRGTLQARGAGQRPVRWCVR
jgi:hypothetical protein